MIFFSWKDGENHLIFNMLSGEAPNYSPVIELNMGKAMVAGADFDTYSYRLGYDVAIPIFSPLAVMTELKDITSER